MSKNDLAWKAATKAGAFKRTPIHHPKNLKDVKVNVGAGNRGLRVEETYSRRSNKLWQGEKQTRTVTSDPTGANKAVFVQSDKGRLTPLGRKVRNYSIGGAAGTAYGAAVYRDYKASSTPNAKKKDVVKSLWGVDHGVGDVSKHYLGFHGEGRHHDRTQHRALRGNKKKAKRYANSASDNAWSVGQKKAEKKGVDRWYRAGESISGAVGGQNGKSAYYRNAGFEPPSHNHGDKARQKWEESKAGKEARRKQGRAKADWNPRWGERHGYKTRDVRKNMEVSKFVRGSNQQKRRNRMGVGLGMAAVPLMGATALPHTSAKAALATGAAMAPGIALAAANRERPKKPVAQVSKAFGFRALGAAKKAKAAVPTNPGVQRGLAMVNNPKVGNVSRVASQKFSAPTPRLGVQKAFTPILSNAGKGSSLSPATRAMRMGQVGGQAQRAGARAQFGQSQFGAAAARIGARRTQGASRFGGPSSQQFAPVGQKMAGQRAAGASRFNQTQGGGAVPRGAGASAHAAASGLRPPTPPRMPNALGMNRKKIAIGATAAGSGGVGYASVKKSIWGVEHGPESISKREELTRSMRKERLAFNKPGARKRVRQDQMRRGAYYSPRAAGYRKENWQTVGRETARGLGYGSGLGVLAGAALTKGSPGGAFGGGYIGAQIGGSVGMLNGSNKVQQRAMSGARRAALERGDIVRVG